MNETKNLIVQVNLLISRTGITASKAAKQIGISSSILSSWQRGNYKGNVENVELAIDKWLIYHADAGLIGMPAQIHADLSVTEEIDLMLSHAQAHSDIVLIYGTAGSGKTYAAERYAERRPQVALATMSPAVGTTLAVLNRVAMAIGFSTTEIRSAARLEDLLVDRLSDRNALLLIDEAHHLMQSMLDELRCLYDRAGCGLALIGNEPLWSKLTGGTRAAQLVSRVGLKKKLGIPVASDVDMLSAQLLQRETTAPEQKLFRLIATRAGGLRAINKTIQTAYAFARGDDRSEISTADLVDASSEIVDDVL